MRFRSHLLYSYIICSDLLIGEEILNTILLLVHDIVRTIETKFIPQLAKAIEKELKRKGDAKLLKASASQPEVGKSSGVVEDALGRAEADLEGGDDDEDDDGDDDATNNKQRQNREEAISYAAPDEGEETIARDARRSSPDLEMEDEGFSGSPPKSQAVGEGEPDDDDDEEKRFRSTIAREREARVKNKTSAVTRFAFDDKAAQWCEIQFEYDVTTAKLLLLPLVESTCHGAIIQAIPGLHACTCSKEEKTGLPVVLTEGVNLPAMHDFQSIINPHRIFTNDIAAMLDHYGVEACRATIIREMDAVFKGHSISVDMRHLNLIADVMTKGGGFKPFNRNGLKSSVSPFMKMSFVRDFGMSSMREGY